MQRGKHWWMAFFASYAAVQASGLVMGSICVCADSGGFDFVAVALVVGFMITAIPTVLYAAILSTTFLFIHPIRRSVGLSALTSIILTGGTFMVGLHIMGESLESALTIRLLVSSVLAGLIGVQAARWYYGRVVENPASQPREGVCT